MSSMDPYEKLANAIIYQAIEDYRKLWNIGDCRQKREIIDFIYSEWFSILTKADPDWLVEKLEEEERAKREEVHRSPQALSARSKVLSRKGRLSLLQDNGVKKQGRKDDDIIF